VNIHLARLYVYENHSRSYTNGSAIVGINTEGKSLSMKLSTELINRGDLNRKIWFNRYVYMFVVIPV